MQRLRAAVPLILTFVWIVSAQCAHQTPRTSRPAAPADLFASLPPLPPDETEPSFAFASTTPARPRPQQKVASLFPSGSQSFLPAAAPPPPGPLRVLRRHPQTTDRPAPGVTVTFNQPMVPVAGLSDLARYPVPLKIAPPVKGKLGWLDPRTAVFEPTGGRMPGSTRFTVTVPAGARAASGERLGSAVSWSFSTELPELNSSRPSDEDEGVDLEPVIAMTFNQRVDPQQVLARLTINGRRAASRGFALVAPERWGEHPGTRRSWQKKRAQMVVAVGKRPWRRATRYRLKIAAGVTGEGQRLARPMTWSFKTYGAFRVRAVRPRDRRYRAPIHGIEVQLSNALGGHDEDDPLSRYVVVRPRVKKLQLDDRGEELRIRGELKPRTSYRVTLRRGLRDEHEQKLVRDQTFTVRTGDIDPGLSVVTGSLVWPWKAGQPAPWVPLRARGITSTRLRMLRLEAREELLTLLGAAQSGEQLDDDDRPIDPLGKVKAKLLLKRRLATRLGRNGEGMVPISLAPAMAAGRRSTRGAGLRPGVVYLDLLTKQLLARDKHGDRFHGALVQVTDIGLMVSHDHQRIVVFASSLHSGAPLGGLDLELRDSEGKVLWTGRTDGGGLATLPGRERLKVSWVTLWGSRGDDQAFVNFDPRSPRSDSVRGMLFTERDPYRPGETVHVKGLLRTITHGAPGAGALAVPRKLPALTLKLYTPRHRLQKKAPVLLSQLGTFDHAFALPAEAPVGRYTLVAEGPDGRSFRRSFTVAEYRAPQFAVKIDAATAAGGPQLLLGTKLRARIRAAYLFGAPLAGGRVDWSLHQQGARFSPPGHAGFSFGPVGVSVPSRVVRQGHDVQLGADGGLTVDYPLERGKAPWADAPRTYTLKARVTATNRQVIASRRELLVLPAELLVGLRPASWVAAAGQPLEVDVVVADAAGKRQAGRAVKLSVLEVPPSGLKPGAMAVAGCAVKSAVSPVACRLILPREGSYRVRAEVRDGAGRRAVSSVDLYAFGGQDTAPGGASKRLQLIADKHSYRPGETARVLVRAPFAGGRGLLTVGRGGMITRRPLAFGASQRSKLVRVKIPAGQAPRLHLGVALARGRRGKLPPSKGAVSDGGRATVARASLHLPVDLDHQRVAVRLETDAKVVQPSGRLTISVITRDAKGAPAPAEVAVAVVDEGVLSLLDYRWPDPMSFFWADHWGEGVGFVDLRRSLIRMPEPPEQRRHINRIYRIKSSFAIQGRRPSRRRLRAAPKKSPFDARRGDTASAPKFSLRKNFASTAHFAPAVRTNEQGRATVRLTMPDTLTTFRIIAVAVDRRRPGGFGGAEARVVVRKPLLLRPSLPRFLAVGDRFEAAVTVHNNTSQAGEVEVLARAGRRLALAETRRELLLAAGASREVRFTARALSAGRLTMQFAAVMPLASSSKEGGRPSHATDAVQRQLPVVVPGSAEAFASYGVTDGSVVLPLAPPREVLPDQGGLEVSLSSTALTGLQDAARYLIGYPHGCTEQLASRLLPLLALKEILDDFNIEGVPDAAARAAMVNSGLGKLLKHQRGDGGFGLWASSTRSSRYLTAYALQVIAAAQQAGVAVPADVIDRGTRYLRRGLGRPLHPERVRFEGASRAHTYWLLSTLGKKPAGLTALVKVRARLPLFARAWLMQALHRRRPRAPEVKAMIAELDGAAVQTAATARFAEPRVDELRLLMHSDDRTDAIALDALLEVAPGHPLIAKLVRGLLAKRRRGRWSTTQSNAYALLAISRYYRQAERQPPDYTARIWTGKRYIGEVAFTGRQLKTVERRVPMRALLSERGVDDLLLAKRGPGKLYYRVGLRYVPATLDLAPLDRGFIVSRQYELHDPKRGKLARLGPRRLRLAAGSVVRVKLKITVPDRRYYVAVTDALPAGLEPIETRFATTDEKLRPWRPRPRPMRGRGRHRRGWAFDHGYHNPFNHTELRDDGARLYADELSAGTYHHSYLARATSLGTFTAAPTRAEEMYAPESFGRGGTLIIEVR